MAVGLRHDPTFWVQLRPPAGHCRCNGLGPLRWLFASVGAKWSSRRTRTLLPFKRQSGYEIPRFSGPYCSKMSRRWHREPTQNWGQIRAHPTRQIAAGNGGVMRVSRGGSFSIENDLRLGFDRKHGFLRVCGKSVSGHSCKPSGPIPAAPHCPLATLAKATDP